MNPFYNWEVNPSFVVVGCCNRSPYYAKAIIFIYILMNPGVPWFQFLDRLPLLFLTKTLHFVLIKKVLLQLTSVEYIRQTNLVTSPMLFAQSYGLLFDSLLDTSFFFTEISLKVIPGPKCKVVIPRALMH